MYRTAVKETEYRYHANTEKSISRTVLATRYRGNPLPYFAFFNIITEKTNEKYQGSVRNHETLTRDVPSRPNMFSSTGLPPIPSRNDFSRDVPSRTNGSHRTMLTKKNGLKSACPTSHCVQYHVRHSITSTTGRGAHCPVNSVTSPSLPVQSRCF